MGNVGAPELIVVLLIAALLFGGRRLPELGRSLGEGIRSFKQGLAELDGDEDT